MPLSSVLGAQSLVRPGVCTSSTRPASPFEGQTIYETDTDLVKSFDGTNWNTIGPTTIPAQEVVQVVYGQTTTDFTTSSTTYVDVTNFTATITPTSSSNDILVMLSAPFNEWTSGANAGWVEMKMLRGSTDIGEQSRNFIPNNNNAAYGQLGFNWMDSPATTSATTYKAQVRVQSGVGLRVRWGNITLMEITV